MGKLDNNKENISADEQKRIRDNEIINYLVSDGGFMQGRERMLIYNLNDIRNDRLFGMSKIFSSKVLCNAIENMLNVPDKNNLIS